MVVRDDIVSVLTRAEDQLITRLQRAVKNREYADVAELATASQRVHDLIRSLDEIPVPTHTAPHAAVSTSKARKAVGERSGNSAGSTTRKKYPTFARDGKQLVKTGWSKKTRKEYKHRVTESAVSAVVSALRDFGATEFSMDELNPVQNEDGTVLPSYQVYLVVAWLRACGAITKTGRGGYSPLPDRIDVGAMNERWSALELDGKQISEGGSIDD